MKEKRKLKNAELKAEKLKQQQLLELTPEWQEQQKQIEQEKERIKKKKEINIMKRGDLKGYKTNKIKRNF